jgi:hypothetical protein
MTPGHIGWSGFWRHYKGGRYLVVAVAETHEHNGDFDVVYISAARGHYVTRPLRQDSRHQDAWTDVVTWPDGRERPRFLHEAQYESGYFDRIFDAHVAGAS